MITTIWRKIGSEPLVNDEEAIHALSTGKESL